ncbi:MAG: SPOR domain-containing protein [Gelidibacter sp.]
MIKPLVKLSFLAVLFFSTSLTLNAQQGVVSIEQDKEIDQLLEYKKDLRTVNAFIIQIFSNSGTSARSEAQSTRSKATTLFPNWSSSLEYEQPNYKIWVGNFRTRLEADRALMEVKKTYAHAFILSPRNNK